jgi:hypothetical protein
MQPRIIICLGIAAAILSFPHTSEIKKPEPDPLIPQALASTTDEERPATITADPWSKVPPLLKRIAACESSYEHTPTAQPRQFEPNGKTVRYGRVDPDDTSAFQINLCGSNSPPLAALLARGSEPDVLPTEIGRWLTSPNTPPLGAGILYYLLPRRRSSSLGL